MFILCRLIFLFSFASHHASASKILNTQYLNQDTRHLFQQTTSSCSFLSTRLLAFAHTPLSPPPPAPGTKGRYTEYLRRNPHRFKPLFILRQKTPLFLLIRAAGIPALDSICTTNKTLKKSIEPRHESRYRERFDIEAWTRLSNLSQCPLSLLQLRGPFLSFFPPPTFSPALVFFFWPRR